MQGRVEPRFQVGDIIEHTPQPDSSLAAIAVVTHVSEYGTVCLSFVSHNRDYDPWGRAFGTPDMYWKVIGRVE